MVRLASITNKEMNKSRIQINIRGAVQGVGFRPFIYRLAKELELSGYVLNNSSGVHIEAEGIETSIRTFLLRIEKEKPTLAIITSLEYSVLDPVGYTEFTIKKSEYNNGVSALILPDIAVCDDCLKEMFNPDDRRYRYPFINCTNCGPRFSIIESLPYDRPNTSMKIFKMCDRCKAEYENPLDRRFHAQPTACPDCGPHLSLWNENGKTISEKENALLEAAELIKQKKIIALKGLGGFQLIADASDDEVINTLRRRKHREEKPFALMFPDLNSIKQLCDISEIEERVLKSPESAIVLLKRKSGIKYPASGISEFIAPGNPYIGAMLPYTPLHHLFMKELNFPVVATSANLSEEPICIDEREALERLKGIADYFFVHSRPIVRHVDDSIVRIVKNREMVIRRARGYAPLPIQLNSKQNKFIDDNVLAVGGHLKNSIALKVKNNVFISQHIGDLSTDEANKTFRKVINDFKLLYNTNPPKVISDLHPEYISTKYAKDKSKDVRTVQHHYAHIASCRLENQIEGEALGVSWDGTGYGLDGTIWGGEFFLSDDSLYKHIGQFKRFLLPGGEIAIKEPKRSLTGLLYEICNKSFDNNSLEILRKYFQEKEIQIITNMMDRKINSPLTSSVGRLFDGVSALLGICSISAYEGQAAMMLEFIAEKNVGESYAFEINEDDILQVDWTLIISEIISDIKNKVGQSVISAKFHNTLTKIILGIAEKVEKEKVILSGGCFQNAYLTEKTIDLLQSKNFKVYWHQRVPPNDGGIALGQIAAYLFSQKAPEENKKNKIINEVQ